MSKNGLWGGVIFGTTKKWDNSPGGTVVDRFTEDGVEYVIVEFKNSPGTGYIYRA